LGEDRKLFYPHYSIIPLFQFSIIPIFQYSIFFEVLPMPDQPSNTPKKAKKPYVRPEVKQVQLKPEEAVLGYCKQTSIFGPGAASCNIPVLACSSNGS
jgi:hypothetical protein